MSEVSFFPPEKVDSIKINGDQKEVQEYEVVEQMIVAFEGSEKSVTVVTNVTLVYYHHP